VIRRILQLRLRHEARRQGLELRGVDGAYQLVDRRTGEPVTALMPSGQLQHMLRAANVRA
jgi:hypothetical protein